MHRPVSLFIASLLGFAATTAAAPITYAVTVNTSSIAGIAGSLDFNFDPGPLVTQASSLQLLTFSSNGTLAGGCLCSSGDVSGMLPATVTFDNGTVFNDYFEGFTFGTTLSFDVRLYGVALSGPDGISTSGSIFAFSMFSNVAGTIPALTTDVTDGFALTVNVNLDGSTTVNDLSTQTTIVPETSAVPEPSSKVLFVTIFALAYLYNQFHEGNSILGKLLVISNYYYGRK